jgi:hypothetical protein
MTVRVRLFSAVPGAETPMTVSAATAAASTRAERDLRM